MNSYIDVVGLDLLTGKRVLLARFCKNKSSGELTVLSRFSNLTILSSTHGMTPPPDHPEFSSHVAAAEALFQEVKAIAATFDMVMLDEVCGAAARGLVNEEELIAFLASLTSKQTAVLTGRGAGVRLLAVADTVSEILSLKHGYQSGITAQEGVEY